MSCGICSWFVFIFFIFVFLVRVFFFFSSRRRHTRCLSDWSSNVCSSDLPFPVVTDHGPGPDRQPPGRGVPAVRVPRPRRRAVEPLQPGPGPPLRRRRLPELRSKDRKSTRLNSSHLGISYAVFCLKKKKKYTT